ncbi:MAG: hypothetical protein WBH03_18000 [Cyclobacteriaceae bacterium]
MLYKWLQAPTFLIVLVMLASGCTTILNRDTQTVRITSLPSKARVTYDDDTYVTPAVLKVERSKHPVYFSIADDSVSKTIELRPSIDRKFAFANLAWMHAMPFAYLIDLTNPRRFHYGKRHHIDLYDTVTILKPPAAINVRPFMNHDFYEEKGQWGVVFGIPYANWYYFRPDNEWQSRDTGYFGLSFGMEYMDRDNRSVRIMGSMMAGHPVPVPVPVFPEGTYDRSSAFSLSLTRQYYIHRLVLGYGLAYSYHIYNFRSNWLRDVRLTTNNLGADLYGGLKLGKYTSMGVRYQPTVYKFSPEVNFQYESIVSIELLFRSF